MPYTYRTFFEIMQGRNEIQLQSIPGRFTLNVQDRSFIFRTLKSLYGKASDGSHWGGQIFVSRLNPFENEFPIYTLDYGQDYLILPIVELAALAAVVRQGYPAIYKKIFAILTNEDHANSDDLWLKVLPDTPSGDREALISVLLGSTDLPNNKSAIIPTYKYFYTRFDRLVWKDHFYPDRLCSMLLGVWYGVTGMEPSDGHRFTSNYLTSMNGDTDLDIPQSCRPVENRV